MSTYNGGLKGGSHITHHKTKIHRTYRLDRRERRFKEHWLSGSLSPILMKYHTPIKYALFRKMATDIRCVAPTF
jgi:fatty acid desaturase